MTNRELFKDIKGVFIPPVTKYYLGKLVYGTPYFYPMNFVSSIIKFRKLKLREEVDYQKIITKSPWLKESHRFTNLPMVRRACDKIFKLFGNYYWIQIGWPIKIARNTLGWKDKWDKPRFEWPPLFAIYFFKWQFIKWWITDNSNTDLYYEMILWYLFYADKDIVKAKETWDWVNYDTKISTWNDEYILKNNKNGSNT